MVDAHENFRIQAAIFIFLRVFRNSNEANFAIPLNYPTNDQLLSETFDSIISDTKLRAWAYVPSVLISDSVG